MKYDHIMVRFGELSTKGKNKNLFIKTLAKNIKNALSEFSDIEIISPDLPKRANEICNGIVVMCRITAATDNKNQCAKQHENRKNFLHFSTSKIQVLNKKRNILEKNLKKTRIIFTRRPT